MLQICKNISERVTHNCWFQEALFICPILKIWWMQYEHQYVISFFELSYNERTLKKSKDACYDVNIENTERS